MRRNGMFSVWFVTCYLFVYCVMIQIPLTAPAAIVMLFLSPLLVVWMVYSVLKYGNYDGPGLEGEEFGYQDKRREDLRTL